MARLRGDLRPVLHALRRKGDEAQVTQVLAAFADADRKFAARLLTVILDHAPEKERVHALGPIPTELICVAENRLQDAGGGEKGYVDLRFDSHAGDLVILVELKLFSGYGHDQLQRYLDGLAALPSKRGALLAVTRDPPRNGEDVVTNDSRWCGSIRWARMLDDLRAIVHADPLLAQAWVTFLDILRSDGDLGTMDFNKDAIRGWNQAVEGRDTLIAVLTEISDRALEIVRDELASVASAASTGSLADFKTIKSRRVWPWKERINLQIRVPAETAERIRIQFLGGVEGGPYFTVEARYPDARRILANHAHPLTVATEKLRQQNFEIGRDWENYWSRLHPSSEWLSAGPSIHDVLLHLVEQDVRDLAVSGIFQALPVQSDGSAPEPPTDLTDG